MSAPVPYIGTYGFLGISILEAYFGAATAATYYEKIESETFETDPGYKPIPLIGGTRAENQQSYGDEQAAVGGFVKPFGPANGPAYLAYALGADIVTGTGPYVHTMTPKEAGIPSFTVEKNLGGLTSMQFKGCVMNKFDLELLTNAPARMTADILPQIDTTPFTPSTPSFVADSPFALANYSVSIFGVANPLVRSIKLSIDNKAKNTFTFSGVRYSTLNFASSRVMTGEVVVILQSMATQYADAMAGTYGALVATLSQGSAASCVFTLPKIQWGKPSQPVKLGELILQTLPFTAFFIAGQPYDIQAVVTNSKTTAYCS